MIEALTAPPQNPARSIAPVRIIAVDLDGTLLDDTARVSPRAFAAITAAERAGIHFIVATGRRHSYAMRVLRDLALRPETVLVTSNGAVVRTFGAAPVDATLTLSTARWLIEYLAEYRNALVLTFDRVGPDGDDIRGALVVEELEDLHNSIARWMEANEPYIARVQPLERALEGEPPIQMMICGTIGRMRRAEAHLLRDGRVAAVGRTGSNPAAEVQLARTEYPDRDLSIVDILPAGCSKGAALLRLAARYGIEPASIMAIGDNWNDLSMLEIAGHPVLMSNAPSDIMEIAVERGWQIAPPNTENGVARIIEALTASLP